jgi:hypothetical protein
MQNKQMRSIAVIDENIIQWYEGRIITHINEQVEQANE